MASKGDTCRTRSIQEAIADFGMEGRKLYLPQMPYGGTYLLAAAIRSIGFDAWPTSDSDERTLDLGGRMTSGDECYPQKIVLGDFLRIIEDEGRDNVAYPHAVGQRAVPVRPVPAPHPEQARRARLRRRAR